MRRVGSPGSAGVRGEGLKAAQGPGVKARQVLGHHPLPVEPSLPMRVPRPLVPQTSVHPTPGLGLVQGAQ